MIDINFIALNVSWRQHQKSLLLLLIFIFLLLCFFQFFKKPASGGTQNIGHVFLSDSSLAELKLMGVMMDHDNRQAIFMGKNKKIARLNVNDKISDRAMILTDIKPRKVILNFNEKVFSI